MTPAIVEPGDHRRIYKVMTNNGNHKIYSKYVSSPSKRKNHGSRLWQFIFTSDEIQMINAYDDTPQCKVLFALICGVQDKIQDSEIVILSLSEAKTCLGLNREAFTTNTYRISIKSEKGIHGLKAYGSGRADRLNGEDHTLRISREMLTKF